MEHERDYLSRRLCKHTVDLSGKPWVNGYYESLNDKLRNDLLNWELFYSLMDAQALIEQCFIYYNIKRLDSALGGRPSVPRDVHPPSFHNSTTRCHAVTYNEVAP